MRGDYEMSAIKFRLLERGFNRGSLNMATDESILIHCCRGEVPPTISLYGWRPPAISIGYFQSLHEEVDLECCRQLGVDFVRRITGGGAVLHDQEVTYSFIIQEDNPLIPRDILTSYERICAGLVRGLALLGLNARFVPLNDLIVGGKKISGNAQTRRGGGILQHGTILIDVDVKKMFSLLRVPQEKMKDKLIKRVEERVTSICQQLGRRVSFDEVCRALARGFEQALGIRLERGELTQSEIELAEQIDREKYSRFEWNNRR
jgi:lipoate-protein ligase A